MNIFKNNIRLVGIMLLFLLVIPETCSCQQNGILDTLTAKFQKFCEMYPWEEVYIHTDRKDYVAGENIWFESYLIDRKSNRLSVENAVLYFEILNKENVPVIQRRIKITKGSGPGQVVLPDTLSSGIYTIRSYTNWMKNFMPANCFFDIIHVYNALNAREVVTEGIDLRKQGDTFSEESVVTSRSRYDLEIDDHNTGKLELHISSDNRINTKPDATLYLIIQTHGNIDFKKSVDLTEGRCDLAIPRNILTPGINQVTVFNQAGKPVVEKYFFTTAVRKNLHEVKSGDVISTREKVDVLVTGDYLYRSDSARMSISVSTATTDYGIEDYLTFGSEFGYKAEQFQGYSLESLPDDLRNKFLSLIRSRWINWESIIAEDYPEIRYEKENQYHFLYGRLINRLSREPLANEYVFLSTPSKDAVFQYAKTDRQGEFRLSIPVNGKVNDLIIQPENGGKDKSIRLISSFAGLGSESMRRHDYSQSGTSSFVSSMAVNYQIGKIFGIKDASIPSQAKVSTGRVKRFYGKPDIELIMDDYIKLPVMQEVFFELLPGTILRKKKSEWELKLSDPASNRVQDGKPVMLVDGVVIDDASIIAELDPDLVERIDVVKERYYLGDYAFYGIVNVITRAGDFSSATLPDYALRLSYRVVDQALEFKSPEYTTVAKEMSRIPDFRNTLYWNPSVKSGPDGKTNIGFWSSDFRGDYEIILQGTTYSGEAFSARKVIRVK